MYSINEYVAVRDLGICLITAVTPDGYAVKPAHSPSQNDISIPPDSIVRSVLSRDDAMDLVDRIPYIRTIQAPTSALQRQLYDAAMASYDGIEWIKVIKSVYIRTQDRRLFSQEVQYSEQAKNYLYTELSVVLEIPFHEVEGYIKDYIKSTL